MRVRGEQREGRVRLYVCDDGIGIAPEHQARIFELFQQVRRDTGGSGIGLAVVRKAMQRMNGTVGVESRPGSGSTFWLELPAPAGLALPRVALDQ
ncbi:MAG: ATP-binding protein [Opitutaceae bacterium]|nr:ATP-binding protein [Opitutaceae bacterium]